MTKQALHFAKMHGLGNDFMVIDAIHQSLTDDQLPVSQFAHRQTGIGFDQLLIIKPSHHADFYCRIFNADGSEAEQCGNGLRCVARYIYENKLCDKKSFAIETLAGIYPILIESFDHITVTMGAPTIKETNLSLHLMNHEAVDGLTVLSVGNPHVVVRVSSINQIDMHTTGAQLSTHQHFPFGTNVGFMEILSPVHIRLRTYERGSGETLACGSNACAAVVSGIQQQWLQDTVDVEFKLGKLKIRWNGNGQPIQMSGPAALVYTGTVCLNN